MKLQINHGGRRPPLQRKRVLQRSQFIFALFLHFLPLTSNRILIPHLLTKHTFALCLLFTSGRPRNQHKIQHSDFLQVVEIQKPAHAEDPPAEHGINWEGGRRPQTPALVLRTPDRAKDRRSLDAAPCLLFTDSGGKGV
jgi:hypothetical protein